MRARFALALLILAVPAAALAAPRTVQELASVIISLLGQATAVLVVAGLVVYLYGVSTNILNFTDKSGEKLKAYFFWGVIVLFVMVSIWGILRLLQNTLFGGNPYLVGSSFDQRNPYARHMSDAGGSRRVS